MGISVYQETSRIEFGSRVTTTVEIPLIPCPSNYFLDWINPISDPLYHTNTQFGYCMPDGITLEIDGLPQDTITKRFTLSIFNKLQTTAGDQQLKYFMQHYLPKFHFSNPQLNRV